MIVVDTNVVAYLLIEGDHTADARAAYRRDPEWVAPLLWRSEMRNALVRYVRAQHLTLADAVAIQEKAEALIGGREYAVVSERVLTLARESGRSAYDCEYVSVAEQLRVRLVTADRPVLLAFPALALSIEDFAKGE